MNCELRLLLAMTRRFPKLKGAGFVSNKLKAFYLRKPRDEETVSVLDFKMDLDPAQNVDGGLLFHPQLYDHREVRFLHEHLREGDVFLDVGANIGFYSLVASRRVGPSGKVIAIEADPYNCDRLRKNIDLNAVCNIQVVNAGVTDEKQVLRLGINPRHRGGNSFFREGPHGIDVECFPLLDIVNAQQIDRIDGVKLDIEGFEYRVMSKYLADADCALHPRFIIVEDNPKWSAKAGGSVLELLRETGYRSLWSSKLNTIMVLS